MPGWLTDGLPPVAALVQNSVTVTTGGTNANAVQAGGSAITLTQIGPDALIPADTQLVTGAPPQTVAPTAFQIAAHAGPLFKNTATSTSSAATLNTVSGIIQTESIATAINSFYTMTVTNSLVSTANTPPSPVPQVEMLSYSNTQGKVQINSITNGAGSFVCIFQNVGSQAFNGTFLIPFHI